MGSLPRLIELDDRLKDKRDKFIILAFYDDSVKTWKDLNKKLEPIRDRYWKGRDLPFPILMDSSGETIKTFGIKGFPTTLLIDPRGKLVQCRDLSGEEFERLLNSQ